LRSLLVNVSPLTVQPATFTIHPLPAAETVVLNLSNCKAGEKRLDILDIAGRVVLSQTISGQPNSAIIDVKNLPNGSYFATLIINEEHFQPQKVLIAK